jgi:hypothetical protein
VNASNLEEIFVVKNTNNVDFETPTTAEAEPAAPKVEK